jgi:hypothetical protein
VARKESGGVKDTTFRVLKVPRQFPLVLVKVCMREGKALGNEWTLL